MHFHASDTGRVCCWHRHFGLTGWPHCCIASQSSCLQHWLLSFLLQIVFCNIQRDMQTLSKRVLLMHRYIWLWHGSMSSSSQKTIWWQKMKLAFRFNLKYLYQQILVMIFSVHVLSAFCSFCSFKSSIISVRSGFSVFRILHAVFVTSVLSVST